MKESVIRTIQDLVINDLNESLKIFTVSEVELYVDFILAHVELCEEVGIDFGDEIVTLFSPKRKSKLKKMILEVERYVIMRN